MSLGRVCPLRLCLRQYRHPRHGAVRDALHRCADHPLHGASDSRPDYRSPHPRPHRKVYRINTSASRTKLTDSMWACDFSGDDGLETLLKSGGVSSENDLFAYFRRLVSAQSGEEGGSFPVAGCSTIAVRNDDGQALFGRNPDWARSTGLVVTCTPDDGYRSINSSSLSAISQAVGTNTFQRLTERQRAALALLLPVDGMNEKGFAVSVNMINDPGAECHQDTGKTDITAILAVRLLLDHAASVDEALALLKQYDMHITEGSFVHLVLTDKSGKCVVVEYVDNKMIVTETPVVTNFYLTNEGGKYGIGTEQSMRRYERLTETLQKTPTMDMIGVRDALDSVSKHNYNEFQSTEWSIVFNLATGEVHYYLRENYLVRYVFRPFTVTD